MVTVPRRLLLAVVAGTLLALGALELACSPGRAEEITSLAVIPLEDRSPDPTESEHLSAGFRALLVKKLKTLPGLRVTQPSGTNPHTYLNLTAVLAGTFSHSSNRVEISLTLLDGRNGKELWSDTAEGSKEDLLELQQSMILSVAEQLRETLSPAERAALEATPAVSPEAWSLFNLGCVEAQSNRREDLVLALGYFEDALRLDPSLVDAYVSMGAIYNQYHYSGWGDGKEVIARAEGNFRRALDLAPGYQRAIAGMIKVFWAKGQTEEVLKQGKQAVIHGDESVDEFMTRARAYFFSSMPDLARPILEKVIDLNRQIHPDPAIHPTLEVAEPYWFMHAVNMHTGSYEEALEGGSSYLETFGENAMIHLGMGFSYHHLGNVDQSLFHYRKAMDLYGETMPAFILYELGTLQEAGGRKGEALEIWELAQETIENRLRQNINQFRDRSVLCAVLGCLGKREAFERELAVLLEEIPDNGYYLSYAAVGLVRLGEYRRALELLERAHAGGYNLGPLDRSRPRMADVPVTWLVYLDGFADLSRLPGFDDLADAAMKRELRLRALY